MAFLESRYDPCKVSTVFLSLVRFWPKAWNFIDSRLLGRPKPEFFLMQYCKRLWYTRFFISNTFISNARLKFAKIQANSKQHPKAELLLFENYWHSSSTLSKEYKNKAKKLSRRRSVSMKMKMKMKNRSHR